MYGRTDSRRLQKILIQGYGHEIAFVPGGASYPADGNRRNGGIKSALMNPDSGGADTPDIERHRQAAALNHLLGDIGLAPRGEPPQWWNLVGRDELGDRMATEAWLAGDTQDVRRLVEAWYASTRAAGRRVLADGKRVDLLRQSMAIQDYAHGLRPERKGPTRSPASDASQRRASIPPTEELKVSLRDTDALREWDTRQDPHYSIWSSVSSWVAGLDSTPWLAPSVAFEELSNRPLLRGSVRRSARHRRDDGVLPSRHKGHRFDRGHGHCLTDRTRRLLD
jgi:hypothetical protein